MQAAFPSMQKLYPKAFKIVIGDGLHLKETVFNLLEGHHKYTIAVLKEERRQLFEEANRLSLLSEPETYRRVKHFTESGITLFPDAGMDTGKR